MDSELGTGRFVRSYERVLLVCLTLIGLGGRTFSCVDGGHTYHVSGTLVDEAGSPVVCAAVSVLGFPKEPVSPGYPAISDPTTTNANGRFQADAGTRGIVWGTCGEFGLYVPPPKPPELDAITLRIDGVAPAVRLAVADDQQKHAIRTERWIELGEVTLTECPPRGCCPALGEYCPLAPEKLRP